MQTQHIKIYTTTTCQFCIRAKALLDSKKCSYEEILIDNNPELKKQMTALSGRTSVPQIWINNQHIGGCDELYELDETDQLDPLLKSQ
ncbi:MAG: glutaredoxin 3 [Endozoicomonadaceae bacterium]|nr:glutaredoxin 3 [Endozoicomonadaceae bacterium]MBE8233252.1 glutaredoxin 3 [Endozoicomonadaceae bacterium]